MKAEKNEGLGLGEGGDLGEPGLGARPDALETVTNISIQSTKHTERTICHYLPTYLPTEYL